MISMTKTRLGALPCPAAVRTGSGAAAAFAAALGGSAGVRWVDQRHQSAFCTARAVDLVPPFIAYNTTSVSAAPERSP